MRSRLLLDNPSPHRFLLLDGDELVGAKQNRVLNVTILVGPHQKLVIPVSCVEQGRWHARSTEFTNEDRMMFAKGRAENIAQVNRSIRGDGSRRADQGAVWRNVAEKAARFKAVTPTGAMSDVYRHVERDVRTFRAAFHASSRQVGGLFFIEGFPAGIELFDASSTLEMSLGRLVESYALDAIEHAPGKHPVPAAASARAYLAQAQDMRAEIFKAVGEGDDVRLEGEGLVGGALVADGRVIHLSVLEAPRRPGREQTPGHRARTMLRRRTGS